MHRPQTGRDLDHLDGLKLLNDTHGHDIGDIAVKATADAIVESTDVCDVVGRFGGDEFLVVLCHDHSGYGDAVAERVNDRLARHGLVVHDSVEPLRASVWVAPPQLGGSASVSSLWTAKP